VFAPVIRLIVAAPLVALLGAAMAVAVWPEGDVTSRDRELVARLTRGGAQRLDADGGHWTSDAVDHAEARPSVHVPTTSRVALASAPRGTVPAPSACTRLDAPVCRDRAGRAAAPPARDRAPPRR
jgi:hypothetical protein